MILSRGGFVLRNEKNKSGCGCLIPTILIVSAVLIFTFASNKSNSSSSGSTKPTDADRSWSVSSSSETFFPKAVPTEPETSAQSNTSASDDFVLGDARYIKNTAKHSYDALSNTTQRDFYKIFEASFNSVTTETYDSKYQTKMFDISKSAVDDPAFISNLNLAYDAFIADYPQSFWIHGYMYQTGQDNRLCLLSRYSSNDVSRMKNDLNSDIGRFYSSVPSGLNDYYLEKYIHDYIIDRCTYNQTVKNAKSKAEADEYKQLHYDVNTAYGALHNGDAICVGYAQAFQLLCKCVGIDCTIINGDTNDNSGTWTDNSGHSWNAALLSGNWYHVDVTWDDMDEPAYQYCYFNITTDQISNNHTPYPLGEGDNIDKILAHNVFLPSCNELTYNYFVYDSDCVRISSIENNQIGQELIKKLDSGDTQLTIYLDPQQINFKDAENLLLHNGNNNYMNRYLDYITDNSSYQYTRYTCWPFDNLNAMVIKLDR